MDFPHIDPVMLDLGFVQIHWYGMMYLIGFAAAWFLLKRRARLGHSPWPAVRVDDLIFYCVLGVVLGGRVGYVLFYNFGSFLEDPLMLFRIWQGGMSFHGGLLGVALAVLLFARSSGAPLMVVADHVAWVTPIGLAAGRFGNFINLLFVILTLYWLRPRPAGSIASLFLIGYGAARVTVEFFREPDAHIGFLAGDWITMGHVLSVPMVVVGVGLWVFSQRSAVTH